MLFLFWSYYLHHPSQTPIKMPSAPFLQWLAEEHRIRSTPVSYTSLQIILLKFYVTIFDIFFQLSFYKRLNNYPSDFLEVEAANGNCRCEQQGVAPKYWSSLGFNFSCRFLINILFPLRNIVSQEALHLFSLLQWRLAIQDLFFSGANYQWANALRYDSHWYFYISKLLYVYGINKCLNTAISLWSVF